jgi:putative oxidoreductase
MSGGYALAGAEARPSLSKRLLATADDPVLLGLRLTLGLVMLPHGLQKTLGLFGGHGFTGTLDYFTGALGIPWLFALAAILAESAGALALVLGLCGRVAALGVGITMAVAASTHLPHGFFMNWFGTQQGEGFEYHLLALALAAAVVVRGSGRASVDRWLLGHR